jgi:monoamine oxidase
MKVIVIGAGASGLMAAHDLSHKGIEVVVLEAENRIGGRIHTFVPPGFSNHIEAGAEFIHGNLPLTLGLAKKARLDYLPVSGKMYQYKNGGFNPHFGEGKVWEDFYRTLEKLEQDCTLQTLLETQFGAAKYDAVRQQAIEMAQGLDLADVSKLSAKSIRAEWLSEETQYRLVTGYTPLLEYLHNSSDLKKYTLHLNSRVSKIRWESGKAEVFTNDASFIADAVVIATSLGNLQQQKIKFEPQIPEIKSQFAKIGFGTVIKIALEFEDRFWEQTHEDLGFLFTEIGLTFWTQLSIKKPILIGWIGHDYVEKYDQISDAGIIKTALGELEAAFKNSKVDVRQKFKAGAVFRYTKNSPSGGGYSWLTLESRSAIRKINKGIESTLWFAGEAFHSGAEVGTVEAALQSGRSVARKVAKNR